MINIKNFKFYKILILLKIILFINLVNSNYCENKRVCSGSAKEVGDKDKYKEPVFIDLPEKIEDYNEDLVKQVKNGVYKDDKEKVTLENLKNYVKDKIKLIKDRDCKEYKKEDLHLHILYIIKDNDLIASKILVNGELGCKYYTSKEIDKDSCTYSYPVIRKQNIDFWFENYLKEGVYNFDKLKDFWNTYKPTYLTSYKKYPLFYFEKNETNKKYFENVEE